MKSTYLIEMLTPKLSSEKFESELEVFADRYGQVLDEGHVVSVPDNPMGEPRFQLTEVIEELGLPLEPDQVLMHMNTFHPKAHLEKTLDDADRLGIRHLMVISGDGGQRLTRLEPADIGSDAGTVTSVQLTEYIMNRHPNQFEVGVAFNPYEPMEQELARLRQKIEAGASFVATQPVFGEEANLSALRDFGMPVFAGVWMSRNLDLLARCLGRDHMDRPDDDPFSVLDRVRKAYPEFGLYVSMLGFKHQWPKLREELTTEDTVPEGRP